MKCLRFLMVCLACLASLNALAQWQWLGADGHKVFSDRPPPADVPDKNILKQPSGASRTSAANAAPVAAPTGAAASAPKPGAPGLKISGKDPQLEAKKKEAEDLEAAKKKAEEEKNKQIKAENCTRARSAKAGLDSGARIRITNDKGEASFMSDSARAAEDQRLGEILKDCS